MPIDVACPNLSLDRTIEVAQAALGTVHRSLESDTRGGGKGVNVARALRSLSVEVRVTGILAGRTGTAVAGMLEDEGIDSAAVRVGGETRSCLTVVAPEGVTVFNESGPSLGRDGWARYQDLVRERLRPGSIFVCSGSFPPGAPNDAAALLTEMAREQDCTVVLDAARVHLERALEAEPDLVKPNLHEALGILEASTDERVEAGPDALARAAEAAAALRERGSKLVVVSAGASGAALATAEGTQVASAPHVAVRNPVGAGDCMVAALAALLERGRRLDLDGLRFAVAVGSAGCETFAAGDVDLVRVDDLLGAPT